LRLGHRHLLDKLTTEDPNIPGRPQVESARWEGATLKVQTSATWVDNDGRRHQLVRRGERLFKDLDSRYREVLDPDLFDVTEELGAAKLDLLVRSTETKIAWAVPSTSEAQIAAEGTDWSVIGSARIDPMTAALGAPLSRGVWELAGKCSLPHAAQQRLMRSSRLEPAIRVDAAGSAAVYARPDGVVILDFDQTELALTRLLRPSGTVTRRGDVVRIPLSGLTVAEPTILKTTVEIDGRPRSDQFRAVIAHSVRRLIRSSARPEHWERTAATIHADAAGSYVEFIAPADTALRVRIGDMHPHARGTYRLVPVRRA
jgi:hypothetical protein